MTILRTNEYDKFTLRSLNREIKPCNLKRITDSLQENNLLFLNPIKVNSKYEIIDGQHRFLAAKKLNLPLYYQVEETLKDEDIILLNANQRPWDDGDYLKFFYNKGNDNYTWFKRKMLEHKLSISSLLNLLGMQRIDVHNFRLGKFKKPEFEEERLLDLKLENNYKIIKCLKEKLKGTRLFNDTVALRKALFYLQEIEGFNIDEFKSKLLLKLEQFRPCSRIRDYIELFIRIYNHNRRNKFYVKEGKIYVD